MLEIVDMKGNAKLMAKVAGLYSEIFEEKPWSEVIPPEQVMMFMVEQFRRPRIVTALACLSGLKRRRVVSFTWMYEIFKTDLREGTRYSPELETLFKGQKKVFYLQEVGTKRKYRRKGIGERLTRELLKKGKREGASFVVLSTNSKATAAKSMFSKVGFKDSGIVRPPEELNRTYWILEL